VGVRLDGTDAEARCRGRGSGDKDCRARGRARGRAGLIGLGLSDWELLGCGWEKLGDGALN
jgi:hypothetical protein